MSFVRVCTPKLFMGIINMFLAENNFKKFTFIGYYCIKFLAMDKKYTIKIWCLLIPLLLFSTHVFSQNGQPFIKNYDPSEYNEHNDAK